MADRIPGRVTAAVLLAFLAASCKTVKPYPLTEPVTPPATAAVIYSSATAVSEISTGTLTVPPVEVAPSTPPVAARPQSPVSKPVEEPKPAATVVSTATAGYPWRTMTQNAFKPGERLSYVIRWGLIKGGYARLSVNGPVEVRGRAAYHLVSEAKSAAAVEAFYKVRDRSDSWLDRQSLVSLGFEKRIHEGKYHLRRTATIDQGIRRFFVESERYDKGFTETREGDLPPHVLDVLASLYFVRTRPLVVGTSFDMDVFDGKKVFPMTLIVHGRETVKVPAGKFDCFHVEPVIRGEGIFIKKGKKLEVWMTADERRIPVRMRTEVFIGYVTADLLEYAH